MKKIISAVKKVASRKGKHRIAKALSQFDQIEAKLARGIEESKAKNAKRLTKIHKLVADHNADADEQDRAHRVRERLRNLFA